MKSNQLGSIHAIITVVLTIALLGTLGFIFWQNFMQKNEDAEQVLVESKNSDTEMVQKNTSKESAVLYKDFRTDKKDGTGLKIASVEDTSMLTGIGVELKLYIEESVGKPTETMGGTVPRVYVIDRLHGNYAAGTSGLGVYQIWGPKNGTEEIDIVAGTQDTAFNCADLTLANVPSELVDGRCQNSDGTGAILTYKNE